MTTAAPTAPLLRADTPREWLATHLEARQAAHDDAHHVAAAAEPRWIDVPGLLADDAAHLRREHVRLQEQDSAPPTAVAKWLAGWFAGGVAAAAGYVFAGASAALLPEPGAARFRLHADGWPDRADPGTDAVAVTAEHPWAGLPRVRVVADDAAVGALAVGTLAAAVGPLVDACRPLAKVGRAALWAEVADSFGLTVLHQLDLPADPAVVDRVQSALRSPGRPWRKVPDLRAALTSEGRVYLGRKGGCCLAYRCGSDAEIDLAALDEESRAYYTRFPPDDAPRYCSTCSLRDQGGCDERQLFWLTQERARRGRA